MWQRVVIEAEDAGRRLDQVLARRLELSRGAVRRLLDAGAVRIGGRAVDAAAKGRPVHATDDIEVADEALAPSPIPMPGLALTVVSEGEGWLIVDKPIRAAVHPLGPAETNTVLNAVVARRPQIVGVGEGGLRSGVVHRLDVDTTGCLLFATDEATWRRMRDAFRQRRVDKVYRALVAGRLQGEGDETMHLAIARHKPALVRVVAPDARPDHAAAPGSRDVPPNARRCTLAWRSIAATSAASLIEVQLGTGFLHQIRAMFAHLGHPLLGDPAYGGPPRLTLPTGPVRVDRPMLHALSLRCEEARGRVEPPTDFQSLVTAAAL